MSVGEVAVIVVAAATGFFVKSSVGMGAPLIAVPFMAAFLGVEQAVVIMTLPLVVANVWLLWEHRAAVRETRLVVPLLSTGVFGAAVGSWLLVHVDDRILSLVLAAVIVVYIIRFFTHPDLQLSATLARYLSPGVGFTAGLMQGSTGISGPLLATYLHSLRLEKRVFVFSVTVLFQTFGIVQIISLAALGRYTPTRLLESFIAFLPVLVVFPLGIRLSRRMSAKVFERAIVVLLAVAAVRLVLSGLGVA